MHRKKSPHSPSAAIPLLKYFQESDDKEIKIDVGPERPRTTITLIENSKGNVPVEWAYETTEDEYKQLKEEHHQAELTRLADIIQKNPHLKFFKEVQDQLPRPAKIMWKSLLKWYNSLSPILKLAARSVIFGATIPPTLAIYAKLYYTSMTQYRDDFNSACDVSMPTCSDSKTHNFEQPCQHLYNQACYMRGIYSLFLSSAIILGIAALVILCLIACNKTSDTRPAEEKDPTLRLRDVLAETQIIQLTRDYPFMSDMSFTAAYKRLTTLNQTMKETIELPFTLWNIIYNYVAPLEEKEILNISSIQNSAKQQVLYTARLSTLESGKALLTVDTSLPIDEQLKNSLSKVSHSQLQKIIEKDDESMSTILESLATKANEITNYDEILRYLTAAKQLEEQSLIYYAHAKDRRDKCIISTDEKSSSPQAAEIVMQADKLKEKFETHVRAQVELHLQKLGVFRTSINNKCAANFGDLSDSIIIARTLAKITS